MNENKTTLNRLNEGDFAYINKINLQGVIRRRLQDLGVVNGTKIKCLKKISSGKEAAFLVRGTMIALRESDSSKVTIYFDDE